MDMVYLPVLLAVLGSPHKPPPVTVAVLDKLVALYRSYDLPLPPPNALLVEGGARGWSRNGGELNAAAYLLERSKDGQGAWLLSGTQRIYEARTTFTRLSETAKTARRVFLNPFEPRFFEDGDLIFAAIEHVRHHDAFAREMLRRAVKQGPRYTDEGELVAPEGASMETRVAFLAMQHWRNEVVQPDSDRAAVAAHIRQVFAREPKVANAEDRAILKRLEVTVSGRYKGADVDERLIDAFCDLTVDRFPEDLPGPQSESPCDPLLAVVRRGFDAVPALLRHVGDERLTRAVHPACMRMPTSLCTVGDLCWTLLLDYTNWEDPGWLGAPDTAKRLAAWWEHARKASERDYCLRCLSAPVGCCPSPELIYLAEKRHPDVLPLAYRAVLRSKREISTWPYEEAIKRSGSPKR